MNTLEEGPDLSQAALLARIEELEAKVQQLGEAANQNVDVFAAGFESVDRRMYSMMRVLTDMFFKPSRLHLKTERQVVMDDETGTPEIVAGRTIDWMQYFAEFHAMLGLVALAETHCKQVAEETPDNVIIFGGEDE